MQGNRDDEGTPKPTMGSSDGDAPGQTGGVATTPGAGGGAAGAGESKPGPATRPAGGGKSPGVSHDIPPSARDR